MAPSRTRLGLLSRPACCVAFASSAHITHSTVFASRSEVLCQLASPVSDDLVKAGTVSPVVQQEDLHDGGKCCPCFCYAVLMKAQAHHQDPTDHKKSLVGAARACSNLSDPASPLSFISAGSSNKSIVRSTTRCNFRYMISNKGLKCS